MEDTIGRTEVGSGFRAAALPPARTAPLHVSNRATGLALRELCRQEYCSVFYATQLPKVNLFQPWKYGCQISTTTRWLHH